MKTMASGRMPVVIGLVLATFGVGHVACSESAAVKEPVPDAGPGTVGSPGTAGAAGTAGTAGSPGDGGPSDCFQNPTTHEEIINACTDAVKIEKNPTLQNLLPDGGLPPIQ